jgi:hypothetical protein
MLVSIQIYGRLAGCGETVGLPCRYFYVSYHTAHGGEKLLVGNSETSRLIWRQAQMAIYELNKKSLTQLNGLGSASSVSQEITCHLEPKASLPLSQEFGLIKVKLSLYARRWHRGTGDIIHIIFKPGRFTPKGTSPPYALAVRLEQNQLLLGRHSTPGSSS